MRCIKKSEKLEWKQFASFWFIIPCFGLMINLVSLANPWGYYCTASMFDLWYLHFPCYHPCPANALVPLHHHWPHLTTTHQLHVLSVFSFHLTWFLKTLVAIFLREDNFFRKWIFVFVMTVGLRGISNKVTIM